MRWTVGFRTISMVLMLIHRAAVGHALRVLFLLPHCGSHVLFHNQIALTLVSYGHQVTVVRFLEKKMFMFADDPNITEYIIGVNNSDGSIPFLTHEENGRVEMPLNRFWDNGLSITALPLNGFITLRAVCAALLSHEPLKEDLRKHRYDVAVVDLLYNECALALVQAHDIPAVGFWALFFAGAQPQYTAAFNIPSAVPTLLSRLSHNMTLPQRFFNFALYLLGKILMEVHLYLISSTISHFLPESPPPAVLLANLSGVLIASHYALDYPRPLPPTFINIGDIHLREAGPLPQDLEDFMQSSGESGVVLFSMGGMLDPKMMPEEALRALLGAFARLQQKVLMKFSSNYSDLPPNVKVSDWFPQQDILGHPKTVLFVTHCGLKGTLEALYHAVPIVGMPISADQGDVLTRLLDKGVAVGISKGDSEDTIHAAMVEGINNPSYRWRARNLSALIRESPEEPAGKRTVRLLEFVARTKGAEHLKVASRHLNFVQFFCIDVLCVMLGLLVTIVHVMMWLKSKIWSVWVEKKSKMD